MFSCRKLVQWVPLFLIAGLVALAVLLHAIYALGEIRAPVFSDEEPGGTDGSRREISGKGFKMSSSLVNSEDKLAEWHIVVNHAEALQACYHDGGKPHFGIIFRWRFRPSVQCGLQEPNAPDVMGDRGLQISLLRFTLIVFIVATLAYLALLYYGQVSFFGWLRSIQHGIALIASRMKSCWNSTDIRIVMEADRLRREYARKCVTVTCPFLLFALGFSAIRANLLHTSSTSRALSEDLSGSELLPLAFGTPVFVVLLYLVKYCHSSTSLDICNFLLSIMWAWRYCTFQRKWYERQATLVWVARIVQGIMLGNARFTNLLHLMVTIFDVFAHAAHEFNSEEAEVGYVYSQLGVMFFVGIVTASFENFMLSEATALFQAKRADRKMAQVHRLLAVLSDAVVHLDAEMNVSKPSKNLAALTLSYTAEHSMLGQPFRNFLVPEDRERFVRFLEEEARAADAQHAETPARALHVKMSCSGGKAFGVEIFVSFVASADVDSSFLVGIKEETEDGRELPDCSINTNIGQNIRPSSNEDPELSSATDKSSASSGADTLSKRYFTVEPSFRFLLEESLDLGTISLLDFSASFSVFFGPSIETGFRFGDWLKKSELRRFFAFARSVMDEIDADDSPKPIPERQFKLRIAPTHLKRSRLRVVSLVTIQPTLCESDICSCQK